ncbi:unnamed protein product, partial [Thlaspi arvense]
TCKMKRHYSSTKRIEKESCSRENKINSIKALSLPRELFRKPSSIDLRRHQRVMERRNMPLSNPHHSTADLLSWTEIRLPDKSSAANRSNQTSDDISEVLGGGCQITSEEAESLNKKKKCCGHKLKEMTGSDLFSDNGKDEASHKTINHYHHDQDSQISFSGGQEKATPRSKKKQVSSSKAKAISGHDIKIRSVLQEEGKGNKNMAPRSSSGQSSEEHVVKSSSRKIHNPRVQQLTSNGVFKSDKVPPGYSEKMHSSAKLREMSGHDVFADGKSEYRDYYGGARRPPGGESTISLV